MNYVRRVSLIVFYTQDKKILLQKRDMKAPTLPGYWGFFGGGIDKNETPREAIEREIYEELLLNIHPIFFKRYVIKQERGWYEKFIYIEPLNIPIEKLRKQQREGETLGLFTLKEISTLKFPEYNKPILHNLEDYFSS